MINKVRKKLLTVIMTLVMVLSLLPAVMLTSLAAAPTITVVGACLSDDTGSLDTDFITSIAAQTISGTLSASLAAGEKVEVSYDGGVSWSDAAASVGGNVWSTTTTLSGSNIFKARVTNSEGSGTAYTHTYTLDTTAPADSDKTITLSAISQTSVTLSWNKATDDTSVQSALQYLVYRSSGNDLDSVANIETNGTAVGSYTSDISTKAVTGLTAGTTYYFNVIVKDEAGNKTCYTTKSVTTTTVPGAPTIGIVSAGDTEATVRFAAPASNGGAAITGYTVTSNPGGLTGTGSSSPIIVGGLTNGTAYTFTVTATNSAGTGAVSAASGSVTPNPGPSVVRVDVPASGYYGTGDNLDFTVIFDQNTIVSGTPRITVVIGSTTVFAQYHAASSTPRNLVFRYTVEAGQTDNDGIAVGALSLNGGMIQNMAGNDATLTLNSVGSTSGVRVDGMAPTAGGSGTITTSDLTSGSVKLTWTTATDTVAAAASLQYKVVYSTSANISTVSNALSNGTVARDWTADLTTYTVTGLSASTNYYFNVLVKDTAGNQTAYTLTMGRTAANSSSGSSSGGSSSGNNRNLGATVIVNGKSQTAGTSQTTTNSRGQTVTTVTVDTGKLENILAAQGTSATVTIPITSGSDIAAVTLTGTMVKSMEEKDATLVIQTNSGGYTLPASEINIDAVSRQLGTSVSLADINVTVSISEPSAAMTQVVKNAALDGGFTIMVPAVDYTITCSYGSQTVSVSSFNAYVERTIAIPDGVDPAKITTGVVVDPDGTVHHVPTKITLIGGKYYAIINSLMNSTYSVIWNPVEFSDVTGHWAKDAINDMGSRMVVTGNGNNRYEPDRNMTRAEFSAIIVRTLGLKPGTGASGFSDVTFTDWCSGYIKTAAAYGIIKGYDNGNFGPNDTITREQAMTMLARAMKITGLTTVLSESEIKELMCRFSDGGSVSSYAEDSIAVCLKTGISSGTSATTLSSKDAITRAEVAVMVERLLQKSGLI